MPGGEIVPQKKRDMVPGYGAAGKVMCPFSLMGPRSCEKEGCEMWMELVYDTKTEAGSINVARCALAWTPKLITEVRASIDGLTKAIKELNKKE